MKKLIILLVSIVFILAACESAGDTAVVDTNANDTSVPAVSVEEPVVEADQDEWPEEIGEQVTITYAMWGDDAEVATLEDVIVSFNQEFPWINVEIIQVDRGEYETWMNTMAAANTLPDTAIMAEPMVIPWAERGALLPI